MNTKKSNIILLVAIFLFGNTALAQFNKPLQSSNTMFYSNQAKYNIGIIGGATSTYWVHFGGTQTPYKSPFNIGIVGGLTLERMLKNDVSLGIEALYAMRNTQLNYEVLNFPIDIDHNVNYYRQFDAIYNEINVQVPLTYYFGQVSSNIRPYVFVAPRVTVPIGGNLIWQKMQIEGYGTENQHLIDAGKTIDTVSLSAQNTWQWNIGLVAGVGVRFKINLGNYYIITKADLSAQAALAHFTFSNSGIHASLLNSFTYEEQSGESQHVVGAGYIDPYLVGMRINTDATAKITILFPLKKQLKGACMNWGEYD